MSINDNITGFAPAGQITPDPENTIDAPNTLTPDASTPIGTPDTVTPVGAGSITAPNTINPDAVNAVDAPNTLTPDAANNVDAPNTLAPDAVNPIATPVGLAPLNSEPINRVLTPLIGLNFSSQNYSVMGQPSTFDNALTYSRASSATYVETYVDALNRKQKRIATVGANVPRFEDAGLLVEGASTNIQVFSEDVANDVYTKTEVTVTANAGLAPDGSFTADRVTDNTADSLHRVLDLNTIVNATNYTMSYFVKSESIRYVSLTGITTGLSVAGGVNTYFDIVNGTIFSGDDGTSKIEDYGNGWFRISRTYLSNATNAATFLLLLSEDGASVNYVGTGKSLLVWGAQFEALPFATSYIKTEGAAVSRAADVCSAPVSVSGGNYTVEAIGKQSSLSTATNIMTLNVGASVNNYVGALVQGSTNAIRAYGILNGAEQYNLITSSENWTSNNVVSVNFGGGVAQAFLNGNLYGSDSSVITANYNTLYLGTVNGSLQAFYGNIKRIEIYDTALTANEVKSL